MLKAKLRYFFRLVNAFVGRFKIVIFLGFIVGVVIFLTTSLVIPRLMPGKVERIAINGRFQTDTLPDEILGQISSGLTSLNEAGIPEPNLAKSWESPDKGNTWIFTLDSTKKWQDGTPLTSDTLVYEFSDVVIERPDVNTIVFKLQDPYSPFPVVVSKPVFRQGLLGTGDWEVKKISIAGVYIQELVLTNKNKDTKIYKFYPSVERTKLALKLGEVDQILKILDPSPFDNWSTLEVTDFSDTTQVVMLFYNWESPAFKDNKPLRQALAYAINKDDLSPDRAYGPIAPNSWGYNPQVKEYNFDLTRAKEVVADLPDEVKANLEIKLVSTPMLLDAAEKISSNWRELGIKTLVQVSSIVPSEFDAFLTIYDIPKDPDQYSVWHSTQESTNLAHFKNDRIDKLLEDGRSTLDTNERRSIYIDFQRFLLEELPAVFLYHPRYFTISRN